MRFPDLGLSEPLLRALRDEGYDDPTPIQAKAIPHVLAGRDVLALAQTGTGKTAAFVLPILERLSKEPRPAGRRSIRVLVIVPTRELASQVGESFRAYGRHLRFRCAVIFGGVGQRPQTDALSHGVDVLVATPGRFLDLLSQRHLRLESLGWFVLDEADRMLDMGFLPDVRRVIAAIPERRQTIFLSATMPREAQALADRILVDPVRIAVAPPATTVEAVAQTAWLVPKAEKPRLLARLLEDPAISRALVFTRTKHGADKLAKILGRFGVRADAIHGNKSQGRREKALGGFRGGTTRVLVATDIAARGIDVEGISHVVNFDVPNVPENYVHRIGRTARAGAAGSAISLVDPTERAFLRDIEKTIRMRIPLVADDGRRVDDAGAERGPAPRREPAASGPERRPSSERPAPAFGHGLDRSHGPARAPHRGAAGRRDPQPRHGGGPHADRRGATSHGFRGSRSPRGGR